MVLAILNSAYDDIQDELVEHATIGEILRKVTENSVKFH